MTLPPTGLDGSVLPRVFSNRLSKIFDDVVGLQIQPTCLITKRISGVVVKHHFESRWTQASKVMLVHEVLKIISIYYNKNNIFALHYEIPTYNVFHCEKQMLSVGIEPAMSASNLFERQFWVKLSNFE